MAIRNTKLGGTDFANGEVLYDYDLDDTNNIIINAVGVGHAENSYKMLQIADVFTNGPNTAADEFIDATGTKNTVNTGTSTAYWETSLGKYILDYTNEASGDVTATTQSSGSWATTSNAFDSNDGTSAVWNSSTSGSQTGSIGKTFSNKFVSVIRYSATNSGNTGSSSNAKTVSLEYYNGSSWVSVQSTTGASNNFATVITGNKLYYFNSTCQGLRVIFSQTFTTNSTSDIGYVYYLEYGDYNSSDTIVCDTNTITLDGTEKAIIVSTPDTTFETGTSMTVIASDGSLSTSAQTINTTSKNTGVFSITSLGSGTLKLTFTLATSDTSKSPLFKGYGVYVIR